MKLSMRSFFPSRDLGWSRSRAICEQPDCHNKAPMRYVPGPKAGISVGEAWYCSADCFANASHDTLASLSSSCVVEMQRNPRLSLGLAMLTKGFLTEEQLRFASLRSQRQGEDLQSTLIECGLATEKQLAAARAAQWGYPVLGLELTSQGVEADLPQNLLRAFRAAPLHYSGRAQRLVLGFVERVDHSLLQSIERITGCRPEACFITPAEFSEQMNRLTVVEGYEEILIDQPGNAAQMAEKLGELAIEITASEASFAKCNSFVWARLSGKRGNVDVIFKIKDVAVTNAMKYRAERPEVSVVLNDRVLGRVADSSL